MTKFASLILFASILSTANLQELRSTNFGSILENNKETSGFTSLSKSTSGQQATISQFMWRQ